MSDTLAPKRALLPSEICSSSQPGTTWFKPRVICSTAISYILLWHLFRYAGFKSSLLGMGEALSYCCHAALFFVLFFFVATNFAPASVTSFYRGIFLRVYPLFFAALAVFWALHIIDGTGFFRGALLIDELSAEGLLTLWFVTVILLFYLLAPLYLTKYSLLRLAFLTGSLFAVLGALKVKAHLVDLRLFQFLLLFALSVATAKSPRVAAVVRNDKLILPAAAVLIAGIYLTARTEARPLISGVVCNMAMLAGIPVFIRLGTMLSKMETWKPFCFLGFVWFAAFLLHRPAYEVVLMAFRPSTVSSILLCLTAVGVPLTLIAAYFFQAGYDKIAAFRS